ncbi:MAG: alpha/beta hydrolase [Flavobacteriales bacterium]
MKKQQLPLEHNFRASSCNLEKSKAIIMLHGYGSDEHDLFSFATELPKDFTIISLKAPNKMQPYGNAWYEIFWGVNGKSIDTEQAKKSLLLIVQSIDEAVKKYHLDKNQISLLGFSQGTILSLALALNHPEKVKNMIALSGYIDESLLSKNYQKNDFSHLKVYASHGKVDQVIPVEWARKTKPFLEGLNISCNYSEFPVGHGVSPQNFYEFKEWLEKNS